MIKRSSSYYLLSGIVVSVVALICLLSYAVTKSLTVTENKIEENLEYVSYEVLTDNIIPVSKEETKEELVRPYKDPKVEIGKSYYDYKSETEDQENAIIYYENTYIQNTGVDYVSKDIFDVNSIKEGKVFSITEDDIVGKTIKIKHDNDMISVYQSVENVKVKENDQVNTGEIIATSGKNNISSELGNHLHFELYKENILVNPEEFLENN